MMGSNLELIGKLYSIRNTDIVQFVTGLMKIRKTSLGSYLPVKLTLALTRYQDALRPLSRKKRKDMLVKAIIKRKRKSNIPNGKESI